MRPILTLLSFTAVLLAAAVPADAGKVDLPRFPSISPNGKRIVFSWRGDLWLVGSQGGHATRLTSHPANELRSAWSPDGRLIAFESERSGYVNIHVMNADGSGVRQVTHADTACILSGFGDGGRVITFQAYREHDVFREPRPYMVPAEGGPVRRLHDAFGRSPRISPDGSRTSFTRGGSSWSRRGYRGPDARDVWLQHRGNGAFRRLTTWRGNDGMARWQDDRTLLYLSDREKDTVNVWRMDVAVGDGSATRLTSFDGRDVQWLDVAANGKIAVLASWDTLYTLPLDHPLPRQIPLTITAAEDEGDRLLLKNVAREVTEARLSPDGKVMAYVAWGEVFVRALKEHSPTARVTETHAREKQIAWSPDGLRLYFVSDRDGTESIYAATVELTRTEVRDAFDEATNGKSDEPETKAEKPAKPPEPAKPAEPAKPPEPGAPPEPEDDPAAEKSEEKDEKKKEDSPAKRWHDALRFAIEPVVATASNDREPWPSPDGTRLAFRRGRGDLAVKELESGAERVLSPGWSQSLEARWSPDGHYIAYHREDRNFNGDVWIQRVDGSRPAVNVSRHPRGDFNPRWSADGKILAFASERTDDEYDAHIVFLDKDLEGYTRLAMEEYFEERRKAVKKREPLDTSKKEKKAKKGGEAKADDEQPAEIPELDLDDAYRRLRRVTKLPGNELSLELTPAGDQIVFTGSDDSDAIFSIKWDGTERKKLRGKGALQHLTLDGDRVVYVAGKQAGTVKTAGGDDKTHAIDMTLEIDRAEFASWKFKEAARVIGEVFYHPTMKGLDWKAVTDRYHDLAMRTRTSGEFDHVAARLLGELNGSHLGIRSPASGSPVRRPNGYLGIDGERSGGEFRVTRVLPEGPAAKSPMKLEEGDVITAIGGQRLRPDRSLEQYLRGTVGQDVLFDVRRTPPDGQPQQLRVLLRPHASGAERQVRYQDWIRGNAELTARWSNDRLGYIHIRSMNASSLGNFQRDLYAAAAGKQGLIVDVRNNGGGYTADLVLASIMVRPHAYTVPRGADPNVKDGYPQGRLFIQRYVMPMDMLCNQKSFSNAEIISHAFKTLGRGKLVGEQTYGGVISTGGYRLVDGTGVRTPFRGWYLPDGTDMENNGAMPDIRVEQTPDAESQGQDPQLFAAVQDVLDRLE